MKTIFTIFIYLSLSSLTAKSQTKAEIENLRTLFATEQHKADYKINTTSTNDVVLFLSGLFLGYKTIFSSQDAAHCVFTPSCSEFALQSIQHKGLITGMLAAFDRLARCNPFSSEWYSVHQQTHLLNDPVQ